MYRAGYGTDVREYDAEIAGMLAAHRYCKKHLPNFDYEAAMLEHARSDPMAIIKGDFQTFDDMLEAAIGMRDSAYGKTRKSPESIVRGDSLDRKFVKKHIVDCVDGEYSQMSGHEQVVAMFDMLDESGILKNLSHKYLAFYYRYDKSLLAEHEGRDANVPTMGMRPGSPCMQLEEKMHAGMDKGDPGTDCGILD